ncbi:hypothetical protein IQ260_07135, partial [Leptolyngbya cf. ectocarpi LEGE 11479]
LRVSDGLIESIQKLIENPRQPQLAVIEIVEALRDAIIQSLSAVENVALGLLDIVGEAIQQLKNLLNAEIKIPFISDLFKLLGAGKLTVLNLSTLLLAIPATIVFKLTTNEKPFTDVVPLEPNDQAQATLVALTDTQPDDNDDEPSKLELKRQAWFTAVTTFSDLWVQTCNIQLDPDPLGFDDAPDLAPHKKVFEYLALTGSLISWGFSVPFTRSTDFKDKPVESTETLSWIWSGGLVFMDLVTLLVGTFSPNKEPQRMRRFNDTTIIIWALASLGDLILALASLSIAEKRADEKSPDTTGVSITYEIFSRFSDFASLARLSANPAKPETMVIPMTIQTVTNFIVWVSILGFGSTLIGLDFRALNELN